MSTVISKDKYYSILFAICIAVTYLNNFELTISVWSLTLFLTITKKYSLTILKLTVCFLAIFSIAFLVMLFKDYKIYNIIRDITYLIKPIIGLLLGYQLCKKNFQKVFQTIVYTGVFIAIFHMILIFYAIIFHNAITVNDIRMYGGYFSDFEIYALIILVFHKNFELGFSKKQLLKYSIIIAISSFMYLARTNFIQFVILFVAMKGLLKINKTSIAVLSSLLLIILIGYSAILYVNPKRNGPGIEALLYKIKIAPTEPFKTKVDFEDWKDFNDNYRSYENIQTVKQITYDGINTIIFGKGIGSQIDLKKKISLGDTELRFISILHNGYMTVLLKAGLIGVFIYLYSIFLFFKLTKTNKPIVSNINLLLIGTGVFLIFSSWVFMGVYNLIDNKSILIGILICYKEMAQKTPIISDNKKND